jgi:hypothetical protein
MIKINIFEYQFVIDKNIFHFKIIKYLGKGLPRAVSFMMPVYIALMFCVLCFYLYLDFSGKAFTLCL